MGRRERLKPSGRPAQVSRHPPQPWLSFGSIPDAPIGDSSGTTSYTETVPKHDTDRGTRPPASRDSRHSFRLTKATSPSLSATEDQERCTKRPTPLGGARRPTRPTEIARSLGRGARAFSGATECPPTLTPGGDTHPRQGRGLPVVGSPTPHPRTWVNAGWPGRTFGRSHGRSGYENERRNRDHRQLARKTGQSLSLVEREGGREAHGKQRVRLHDQ